MISGESTKSTNDIGIRIYGASASSVKKGIETITSVNPGKKAVHTKETGRVSVTPEIYSQLGGCDGGGGGGGGGELLCLIIIAIVMAVFAVVWAIVMIAFSILTLGGFIKRRYRTLVVCETENREFLGKLAVLSVRNGGVLDYPFGNPQYDEWVTDTFGLFTRKKNIRQLSLALGFGWGIIEIGFKLYQIIIDQSFNYDLWPLRYVMIAIFVPLILYSPFLEMKFREAFDTGEEMIIRLVNQESSFSPDHPMNFEEEPRFIDLKLDPPKKSWR
ncbi:MAG: hypothetical protein ACXAEJ_16360 [Candidatus Thorarchaeota archaeon]|jgi:hypothetical protein